MIRLLIAAALAVCMHAALFWVELPTTRPTVRIPRSRAVSIDLFAVPAAKEETPPVKPAAVDRPMPQPKPTPSVPPKPRPTPRPKPKPRAMSKRVEPAEQKTEPDPPEADPAPAAIDAAVLPVSPDAGRHQIPDQEALAEPEPATPAMDHAVEAQAEVQVSEPLYHLNPPPRYPRVARRRNYQGTVILDVLVTADGRAARVQVATSSGHAVLDRSAAESVKHWKFKPARQAGAAIAMWVQVPVRYTLR